MESTAQPALTLWNALPAYKWNVEYTDQAIAKITDEIADFRPPSPDGAWQFSLKEIAAHIVDAANMFCMHLMGVEEDESAYFMKYPEDGGGVWTPNREFTLQEVREKLAEIRGKYAEVLNWSIEKAYEPTEGTKKQFEEQKKMAEEGKFPREALANGPSNPMRVLAAVISHEAGHRGALIAYLRAFHGVSFKEETES